MAEGAGKYDEAATVARAMTDASGLVLIVLGGNKGQGFSSQFTNPEMIYATPALLRAVADQIEADAKVIREKAWIEKHDEVLHKALRKRFSVRLSNALGEPSLNAVTGFANASMRMMSTTKMQFDVPLKELEIGGFTYGRKGDETFRVRREADAEDEEEKGN